MGVMMISVIIAVYNSEHYILECVNSIMNQTYSDFEIILVNDGSTDNSLQICKSLKEKYNSRIILHSQDNKGVSAARNAGLHYATGDYIYFMDSDDCIHERTFEIFMDTYNERQDIKLISCGYARDYKSLKLSDEVQVHSARKLSDSLWTSTALFDNYLWNKLFLRSIIFQNEISFDEEINVWEDLLFVLEYMKYVDYVAVNKSVLYFYRLNSESIVSTKNNYKKALSRYIVAKKILFQECSSQGVKCRLRELYLPILIEYTFQGIKEGRLSDKELLSCEEEMKIKSFQTVNLSKTDKIKYMICGIAFFLAKLKRA